MMEDKTIKAKLTCAESTHCLLNAAFTLAEVLITLGIIGIVAAMTIPTLIQKYREKVFVTAHKRVNSIIANSMAFVSNNDEMTAAKDAEDFVKNYLQKYMKMSKTCGYENHSACGFTDTIYNANGESMDLPAVIEDLNSQILSYTDIDGKVYAPQTLKSIDRRGYSFLTMNGYSMMLFYNPACQNYTNSTYYSQDKVCVNILWDMNGKANPNKINSDIGFTTVLYPEFSRTVTPIPYISMAGTATYDDATKLCQSTAGTEYRVPNIEELGAMYMNADLFGWSGRYYLWSSTPYSSTRAWRQGRTSYSEARSYQFYVWCIRL